MSLELKKLASGLKKGNMTKTMSEAELYLKIAVFLDMRFGNGGENLQVPIATNEIMGIIKQEKELSFKAGQQQALDWVEKEVIGEDEDTNLDINQPDAELIQNYNLIRNQLRKHQCQLIKQRNK